MPSSSAVLSKEVEKILAETDSEDEDLDDYGISLEDILNEESDSASTAGGGLEKSLFMKTSTAQQQQQKKSNSSSSSSVVKNTLSNGTEYKSRSALEVAQAREEQLLHASCGELISPLQVKRRLGARLSKNDNQNGVVKVEGMMKISKQLQKNIDFKENGPGSPTAVAVHPKFIAIGTSKSLVIIFDHFQNVRQILGNTNDADCDGPVTAIDVSPQNDFLVCGYQTGRIVLWDMIKGNSLKAVSDAHEKPVISLRFLKDIKPVIISVDSDGVVNKVSFSKMMGYMYVVDVDLVLDGAAGKIPSIAVLPQLPTTTQNTSSTSFSTTMEHYCLVALSSYKVTFILALEPELKLLHRWPKPDDIDDDDPVLPSLSFGWVSIAGHSLELSPVLVRSWGHHIQFLELTFPQLAKKDSPNISMSTSEASNGLSGGSSNSSTFFNTKITYKKNTDDPGNDMWPVFEVHKQLNIPSEVVAIQWLGDQIVVYLNVHDELCVYDTMSQKELEVVDVSSLELVYAFFKNSSSNNNETGRSFANSFRACDEMLYLLGLRELRTARVQPWTKRIDTLVENGEWLEALALALDHYESLKLAAADRSERDRFPPVFFQLENNQQCLVDIFRMAQTNQQTGEKADVFRYEDGIHAVRWCCGDISYSKSISLKLETSFQNARSGLVTANVPIGVSDRVADLLMDYVRLAIANAPLSTTNHKFDLAKSHYQMLAGVCIEYCAVIGKVDILFNEVFKRFQECGKSDVLVELFEPYILSDRLQYLSPEALVEFVNHALKKQESNLARVEQCFLHLQVARAPYEKEAYLNQLLELCRTHSLYSPLCYVYNIGQKDYLTPIDLLLGASKKNKAIGYKLLLYVSYVLRGVTFPHENSMTTILHTTEIGNVKSALCHHLFQKKENTYPRLSALLHLDIEESLAMIGRRLFESADLLFEKDGEEEKYEYRQNDDLEERNKEIVHSNHVVKCPSRLSMVLALAQVIVGEPGQDKAKTDFSSLEQGYFYMFEAKLMANENNVLDPNVYAARRSGGEKKKSWMMNSLLRFLALGSSSKQNKDAHNNFEERQEIIVKLLAKLTPPREFYDEEKLLRLVLQQHMNRAAVLLHKARNEFSETIAAYLADSDREYQLTVFSYIRNEMEKHNEEDQQDHQGNKMEEILIPLRSLKEGMLLHTNDLLLVDAYSLVVLLLELFASLHKDIVLQFKRQPNVEAEFIYLKQLLPVYNSSSSNISMHGTGMKQKSSKNTASEKNDIDDNQIEVVMELLEKSKLRVDNDTDLQERFISLLCQFEPENVFPYLENHDSYRVDTCLTICRENGITDAEAYLLERTGDVTGALSLILQSLEKKLKILKPALRGVNMNDNNDESNGDSSSNATAGNPAEDSCNRTRETTVESKENNVTAWILTTLAEGKDVMKTLEVAIAMCQRNSKRNHDEQSEKLWFTLLDKCLKVQNYIKKVIQEKSKGRSSTRGTQTVFQMVLNELIRTILERMSTYVSLQSILFKITTEHGKDEWGDFRPTIFGMLETYNYEQNIYQTVNKVNSNDLYEQAIMLHHQQSKCLASSSSSTNCYGCGVSLTRPPFGRIISENNNAQVKWNSQTSMIMILATGHCFHESCGKLWQEKDDKKSKQNRSRRRLDSGSGGLENDENESVSSTSLTAPAPLRRPMKSSNRRYLNRVKKIRHQMAKTPKMHEVLEKIYKEENTQKKYLHTTGNSFSLAASALKKPKRVGSRKPGSLPSKPAQKGSIGA